MSSKSAPNIAKKLRRLYGDNSGKLRFPGKQMTIGDDIMGTATTLQNKYNLVFEIEI